LYSQNARVLLVLALDAFTVIVVAWFWLHCADPELRFVRAGGLARGVVLGISLLTMLVQAFDALTVVAHFHVPGQWWVITMTGALWIVVVAVGYLQRYRFLLRATGSD